MPLARVEEAGGRYGEVVSFLMYFEDGGDGIWGWILSPK